ncbi:DUF6777 domain-containing protein [Actinocorallia populi]|uniref:DUF6777 domain-containing protein n=1 Tax=Actinocorallia populi TaxID=2079200 RepID=UPI000D08E185|nr:DUF6777 domain-containing protein [Actinocorallia populi]
MSTRVTRTRTATAALFLLLMSVTACGEAGKTITRLAVGDPGPDPYTLAANADDDERVDRRAEAGGQVEGDAPGLYGGTRKAASCDKTALVEFLQAGAEKAEAWSGVLGITPGEIPGFVAGLTPAVLRVDTLVTNHGYREGTATALPAVLQAGVAVLVDRNGVPVVKCNCGNPLTPPDKEIDPTESDFRGASWPQFSGEKVTVIETPGQEVESLTLVDSETETAFERPVGTGGDRDGAAKPIPAAARSEPPVSTNGQTPGPTTPGGLPTAPGGPGTSTGPDPSADPGTSFGPGTPTAPGTPGETSSESPSQEPAETEATEDPSPATGAQTPEEAPSAAVEEDPGPTAEAPEPGGGTVEPDPGPAGPAQTQQSGQQTEQPRPQEVQTEPRQTQQPRTEEPEPEPGPEVTGG